MKEKCKSRRLYCEKFSLEELISIYVATVRYSMLLKFVFCLVGVYMNLGNLMFNYVCSLQYMHMKSHSPQHVPCFLIYMCTVVFVIIF